MLKQRPLAPGWFQQGVVERRDGTFQHETLYADRYAGQLFYKGSPVFKRAPRMLLRTRMQLVYPALNWLNN
jgi:hypothetical protein